MLPQGPGALSLTVLLSVLSPGHGCAPEDASIKIPVLSAKWRSSLETFLQSFKQAFRKAEVFSTRVLRTLPETNIWGGQLAECENLL